MERAPPNIENLRTIFETRLSTAESAADLSKDLRGRYANWAIDCQWLGFLLVASGHANMPVMPDTGPWDYIEEPGAIDSAHRYVLESHDSATDVRLSISGSFRSDAHRRQYARSIARLLTVAGIASDTVVVQDRDR